MQIIDLKYLKSKIETDLNSEIISGRTLLDSLRVIDESSRKTASYVDHRFSPFYYYLGKYMKPQSMIEIGFDLGLLSSCFLKSCKTVQKFVGFKEKTTEYASNRLGKSNIKQNFKNEKKYFLGNLYDEDFLNCISATHFDLAIINEETKYDKHLEYLDIVWNHLSENGIIIVEYFGRHNPSKDAFLGFCHNKHRIPEQFPTRYGTAIVQK